MKLDRRLFLVQTVKSENATYHLHSAPISMDVWKVYFEALSQVYTKMFMGGLAAATGPGTAVLMLEKWARANGEWDGPEGVRDGLLPELRRLTNVVLATPKGWETIPYEVAIIQGLIDEESQMEAENAIVFFICVSSVLRGPSSREKMGVILAVMSRLWDHAQISSLDIMEYCASLPISTQSAPSTPKAVSSVPS
jgi:hypothetical protein